MQICMDEYSDRQRGRIVRTGIGSLKAWMGAALVAGLSLGGAVGLASPAFASNATSAHLCQMGQWQALAPNNSSPAFTSEEQCVAYGAHGGTPVPFNPNWASEGT